MTLTSIRLATSCGSIRTCKVRRCRLNERIGLLLYRNSLAALAITFLSPLSAEAACTRWQAEATWSTRQGEHTYTGVAEDKQTALRNARAACASATAQADAKESCRTAEPNAKDIYVPTAGASMSP